MRIPCRQAEEVGVVEVSSVALRDYQHAGIDGLREGFRAGHRSQMLYMSTGSGKTEVAIAMMEAASKKGTRAAMVLDRIVLCNQTSNRLDRYKIPHGVLQAGHWRWRPDERIQVCSAQTIEKRGSFPDIDLLIVDEAHQTRKATAELIASHPTLKVIGLSASPFTSGLASIYTNVVSPITTEQLVKAGNLVPLRVFQAKQIDMTGAKKIAGEWSDKEASERGIKITGDVVTEWVAKTNAIFGGPKKTIVFCAGVAHGEDLVRKFAEAGYNFVSISYKDDDNLKRDVIDDFSRPDTAIHGLIATDILTKGFDCPDAMIGVSARPFSKSLSSHVQQMGRVMRPSPGKDFALWLDFSGNYLRFRKDWEEVFSNGCTELKDGQEAAKKEPTEREKKEALCPRCGVAFAPHDDTCGHCGFQRMRRNGVVVLPGELEELEAKAKASGQAEQSFYSEILFIGRQRGYAEGWAYHQFVKKFGHPPKGLHTEGKSPTFSTLQWERSRRIAFAKTRSKVAA